MKLKRNLDNLVEGTLSVFAYPTILRRSKKINYNPTTNTTSKIIGRTLLGYALFGTSTAIIATLASYNPPFFEGKNINESVNLGVGLGLFTITSNTLSGLYEYLRNKPFENNSGDRQWH